MTNKVDFMGIGAGRSGTTWVTQILEDHPQISFSSPRELNYFSSPRSDNSKSEYDKIGIKGYLKMFDSCKKETIKGEFSAHYLPDPKVAKIIKKNFPNIKLWASLREPVERAFSDYKRGKEFHLKEKESFEKAFSSDNNALYKKGDGYRARGYYYKQLKKYFDIFPKKNIKVILYDDIKNDPKKVVKEMYEFLGVDSDFVPPSLNKRINIYSGTKFKSIRGIINSLATIYHKLEAGSLGKVFITFKRATKINSLFNAINEANTKKKDKKGDLDPKTEAKFKKTYAEDITKLEKLINRNLGAWK